MITKRLLNGSGKLYLRKCSAPFYRTGSAFRIPYLGDAPVSGEKPDPEAPAVPNGCGYRYNGFYVFRRVDRVWIMISDDRLAKVVEEAVNSWRDGLELSFEDLQGLADADSTLTAVAYSAGILGPQEFRREPERFDGRIRIREGWFEDNLFEYMVYRDGLALYEIFSQDLPHVMTAYRLHRPVKRAKLGSRLEAESAVVEDSYLIEIAEACDGEASVGEILKECGSLYEEEVAWGIAVLAGLGCIDLLSPAESTSPTSFLQQN